MGPFSSLYRALFCLTLSATVAFSGCGGGAVSTDLRTIKWEDSPRVPGITQGSVVSANFSASGEKLPHLAIWSDLPNATATVSTGVLGTSVSGSLTNDQGQTIQFSAKAGDFKPHGASVKIGNQIAQFPTGKIILLSSQKSEPELKIVDVPSDSEFWKILNREDGDPPTELGFFARENKDVEEFFKSRAPVDESI